MTKKSDIPELLDRVGTFIKDCEKARGGTQKLIKAAPLEIHLYNIATNTKNELENFKSLIEDTQGTYLSERN